MTQTHLIINWVKWVLIQLNPININVYWVLTSYPIRPNYDPSIIFTNRQTQKYPKTTKNFQNTPKPKKWPKYPLNLKLTKIPLKKKKTKIPFNLKISKIPLKPKKWPKYLLNLKITKYPQNLKIDKNIPKPKEWPKYCWKNTCLYRIQNICSEKLTDLLYSQLITCTI